MPLDARLALVALAVAIVGLPMSGLTGPVTYSLYGVALAFLLAAVFGDTVWRRWRSWRLRGIQFKQFLAAGEGNETCRRVRITLTKPVKHGLLITCSPDTWIEGSPEATVNHGHVNDFFTQSSIGPRHRIRTQGRGNNVLVCFSLGKGSIEKKTGTMIGIDLASDIYATSVEPATKKHVRQFLSGEQ